MRARLSGGDRRSIGAADQVASDLEAGTVDVAEIVALLGGEHGPIVAMRAADALEKATRAHPELLIPHRRALLGMLATADQPEVRWHLAQLVPRLELGASAAADTIDVLEGWLEDPSSIVKTNVLQALADLAEQHPGLQGRVASILTSAQDHATPAMRARLRHLLA